MDIPTGFIPNPVDKKSRWIRLSGRFRDKQAVIRVDNEIKPAKN
jgi:hypothetical protein